MCNELFECAWQELRPVPRVTIDFGGGRVLRRTLNGNIATWLCMPDGRVVDAVAGLVTPGELLAHLRTALALSRRVGRGDLGALEAYHGPRDAHAAVVPAPPGPPSAAVLPRNDVSKSVVELPVKHALEPLHADSAYNRDVRGVQVHAMLAAEPLQQPAHYTTRMFRDILGVDLDDPFLGLAPQALGGEDGRETGRK